MSENPHRLYNVTNKKTGQSEWKDYSKLTPKERKDIPPIGTEATVAHNLKLIDPKAYKEIYHLGVQVQDRDEGGRWRKSNTNTKKPDDSQRGTTKPPKINEVKKPVAGKPEDKDRLKRIGSFFRNLGLLAIAGGSVNLINKIDEHNDGVDERNKLRNVVSAGEKSMAEDGKDSSHVTYRITLPEDGEVPKVVVNPVRENVDEEMQNVEVEKEVEEVEEEDRPVSEIFNEYLEEWFSKGETSVEVDTFVIEKPADTSTEDKVEESPDLVGEKSVSEWRDDYKFESDGADPLLTQLITNGRVKDLEKALGAVYEEHLKHLTESEKGKKDMELAVENLSKLDLESFLKPFIEKGVPIDMALLIAIQESRGKVDTVSAGGALGLTGVISATAEAYEQEPEDMFEIEKAGIVTASYVVDEGEVFNNDRPSVLSVYNSGRTDVAEYVLGTKRHERDAKSFYKFLERKLNSITYSIFQAKFYKHKVDVGQTLNKIAFKYKTTVERIKRVNPGLDPNKISIGQEIKVPMSMEVAIKTVRAIKKLIEMLQYAPEVFAKKKALEDRGLWKELEEAHLADINESKDSKT